MSVRMIAVVLAVVMAFVGGMVWQRQASNSARAQPEQPAAEPRDASEAQGMALDEQVFAPPADAKPGLVWTVPKRWGSLGERPMRVATYSIPAAAGDNESGECAVFYFGPAQGGGVEDNIARWVSQFENAKSPRRVTTTVNGLTVHRVMVTGDYLAPSGPMMQSSGTKKDFMLIGAIVDGPAGGVFFKLTGPERTVEAATSEFDLMLQTLKKA